MKVLLLLDNFLTPEMRQYSTGNFRVKWFSLIGICRQFLKGEESVALEFDLFYFQMLLKIRLLVMGNLFSY